MRQYLYFLLLLVSAMVCSKWLSAQDADTQFIVHLSEVEVRDLRKWTNDTARYRFNQMRYYVTTILPYVNAATKTFNEVHHKINEQNISRRDRKLFIRSREEELRNQFEEKVKALNETQGVLLIKLIARQTGANIFTILSEFKNPFTAIKWQTWAKMNGFNLNKKYNPDDEPLLEQVMLSLNYDLPSFYNQQIPTKPYWR